MKLRLLSRADRERDLALIGKIMDRAERLACSLDRPCDRAYLTATLTFCHFGPQPLELAELLEARDGDFAHDVWGINRHMDESGQLGDCFSPRYSQREQA